MKGKGVMDTYLWTPPPRRQTVAAVAGLPGAVAGPPAAVAGLPAAVAGPPAAAEDPQLGPYPHLLVSRHDLRLPASSLLSSFQSWLPKSHTQNDMARPPSRPGSVQDLSGCEVTMTSPAGLLANQPTSQPNHPEQPTHMDRRRLDPESEVRHRSVCEGPAAPYGSSSDRPLPSMTHAPDQAHASLRRGGQVAAPPRSRAVWGCPLTSRHVRSCCGC